MFRGGFRGYDTVRRVGRVLSGFQNLGFGIGSLSFMQLGESRVIVAASGFDPGFRLIDYRACALHKQLVIARIENNQ